jgi:hypothetical protein
MTLKVPTAVTSITAAMVLAMTIGQTTGKAATTETATITMDNGDCEIIMGEVFFNASPILILLAIT